MSENKKKFLGWLFLGFLVVVIALTESQHTADPRLETGAVPVAQTEPAMVPVTFYFGRNVRDFDVAVSSPDHPDVIWTKQFKPKFGQVKGSVEIPEFWLKSSYPEVKLTFLRGTFPSTQYLYDMPPWNGLGDLVFWVENRNGEPCLSWNKNTTCLASKSESTP